MKEYQKLIQEAAAWGMYIQHNTDGSIFLVKDGKDEGVPYSKLTRRQKELLEEFVECAPESEEAKSVFKKY